MIGDRERAWRREQQYWPHDPGINGRRRFLDGYDAGYRQCARDRIASSAAVFALVITLVIVVLLTG